jgi:hypothetical protein
MGRPIKQKWLNPQPLNYGQGAGAGLVLGSSVGGQQIAADVSGNITLNSLTKGLGYYTGNVYAQIAGPNMDDGTQATIDTVHLWANGAVKAFHLSNAGAGYTTTNPAITVYAPGLNGNTTPATATATLANHGKTAAIRGNAWFTGTTTGDYFADFIKQRGSHTFVMANVAGLNQVKQTLRLESTNNTGSSSSYAGLGPTAAGNVTIGAEFADGSTFQVKKITDRKVWSNDGHIYKWSLTTSANVSASNITVKVDSI